LEADQNRADRSSRPVQSEVRRDDFEADDDGGPTRRHTWRWGFGATARVAVLVWTPAFVAAPPESHIPVGNACLIGPPTWLERFAPSVIVTVSCPGDCPDEPTPTVRVNRTLTGWGNSGPLFQRVDGCGLILGP